MCAGGDFQPQLSLTPGCHFCAVCRMGCKAVNWFFSVPGHAVSLPCPQMLTKLANIAEPGLLQVSEVVFLKWCFTRWMSQRAAGPSCTFPLPTSFPWGWDHEQVQASQHHLGAPFHRKYKVGYLLF